MRSVPPRSVVNAPLESARRHGRSGATTVKTRDSGMPDEELWASFFAPAKEIAMLGLNADIGNAADFGCGYGTFAAPAAKVVRGTVYALDIDPAMVAATRARADAEGVRNVEANARDIVACGTGLPDAAVDYAMLFNILHCEDPFKLMADPATPPSIRARTAQCVLECANRSLELEDIEVRLARLEENEQRGRGDTSPGGKRGEGAASKPA